MTAIAAAASQAERELRETTNLPAVAGSLHDLAIEDLKCARGIGDELAKLGREAFSLLAISDVSVEASDDEPPTPVPITGQSEAQPVEPSSATPAVLEPPEAVASGGEMQAHDVLGTQATAEATDEQPVVPGAGGVETAPVSAADELRREFEAAESGSGIGGSSIQEAVGDTNARLEAPRSGSQDTASPTSAAGELEQELAELRSQLGSTELPDAPVITSPGTRAAPGGMAGSDTQEGSLETASGGLLRRSELDRDSADHPEPVAPAAEPIPSTPLPESYSGRVYLMSPASLTQDQLESVWDSLEEVAGSGTISDHQLISRRDGVQFTLELGNKDLVVDRLRNQMPGAGLTALAEDRLRIDWPRNG